MSRATARRLAIDDQPLLPIGEVATPVVPITTPRRVSVRAHLRTVGGEAPPSGHERKEAALDTLAARAVTQRMVAYVRGELRAIYRRRMALLGPDAAHVTADDVEDVLRLWADCPKEGQPAHAKQFWRGTVFRGKGWRQLRGRTEPSRRDHMNATAMPLWVPTDTDETATP